MTNRLPAALRRRQLLDVAVTVFGRNGFHGAAMADIAEAAGVTKPVLYQHFSSKRAMYLEVLADAGWRLRDAIDAATADASGPREQVMQGLSAFFRFVDGERDAFTVVFGGGTRGDEEFAAAAAAVEAAITRSIASRLDVAGLNLDERDVLAHGIVGIAEGAARQWLAQGGRQPVADVAALVGRVSWSGLRGLAPAVFEP